MNEGDLNGQLLDQYGSSGPHSLWEGMSRDSELSMDVVNTIFSHYIEIMSEKLGMAHPLNTVLNAYRIGALNYFFNTVDPDDTEPEGLPLPSVAIVGFDGGVVPILEIGFSEFRDLLNGTPELVASLMKFLYLNFSISYGLTTVYIDADGDFSLDDPTNWGMNYTVASTLIALGVEHSRYSVGADNQLSNEQRHFYSRVLDEAGRMWDVPTDGPFVLN